MAATCIAQGVAGGHFALPITRDTYNRPGNRSLVIQPCDGSIKVALSANYERRFTVCALSIVSQGEREKRKAAVFSQVIEIYHLATTTSGCQLLNVPGQSAQRMFPGLFSTSNGVAGAPHNCGSLDLAMSFPHVRSAMRRPHGTLCVSFRASAGYHSALTSI